MSRPLALLLAADDAPQSGLLDLLLPLGLVFLIFWFIVFRPASRERKQREARVRSLARNDKVVTNAGIHGTVVGLDDDTVTLRVDDKNNVRIRFSRAAVWQVQDAGTRAQDDKAAARAGGPA
jgi:preprotein translocase subunit YajC